MTLSRRKFFTLAGTGTAGALILSPLQAFYAKRAFAAGPYGSLQTDPLGVLDLPAGFSYVRLSETGQPMSDGYIVPGGHDGMGAFAGANGNTILVRNHELGPTSSNGVGAPSGNKYDTQGRGGTTTLVVSSNRTLISHYGSLAGTYRNCAGGRTPWGSWLSCEESFETGNKKHGYVFEVPSSATGFVTPVPLVAMGRFNHEAAAVDPNTGYVYMTEDRSDGLLYRFVPNTRNNLSSGGALYALRISAKPQANTTTGFIVGQSHAVNWVRITNPDPANDTIRATGFNLGAAKFARGEGIFYSNGDIYFSCTSGGSAGVGQIWRYTPATETLRLYIQPNNASILDFPDNIAVAPNGDLFLCEDGGGTDFIVGVTPTGSLYKFARNALNSNELTGVCFSPNGQIMFVNMQTPGITFAISGPW